SRVLIVDEVIQAGRAVAGVERLVGQGREVVHDGRHAGLRGVGAVGVGGVAPRIGVGILDLQHRWRGGVAVSVAINQRGSGTDGNGIRSGAAQLKLVIVVAYGVLVGQRGEVGYVPGRHVVEAHGDSALER